MSSRFGFLLAIAAVATALVVLLLRDESRRDSGPGVIGPAGAGGLSLPDLPRERPTGLALPSDERTSVPSEREHPAPDAGRRVLPVRLFGPGGAPLAELLRTLRFGYNATLEVRALRATQPLGSLSNGPNEGRLEVRVNSIGKDGRPGGVGALALASGREGLSAAVAIEGVIVRSLQLPADAEKLDIELEESDLAPWFGSLRVRFEGERPDADLGGYLYVPLPKSGRALAPLDLENSALLGGVPGGTYALLAEIEGYGSWRRLVEMQPGEALDLGLLPLHRKRDIRGRILGAEAAVKYRRVELARLGETEGLVSEDKHRVVDSDGMGAFAFEDVPPARWTLRVVRGKSERDLGGDAPSGHVLTNSGWMGIGEQGEVLPGRSRLEERPESGFVAVDTRGGSVELDGPRVIEPDEVVFRSLFQGEPIVRCELTDAAGNFVQAWSLAPDADVRFRIVPGTYRLRAFRGEAQVGEREITSEPGLVITLEP